MSLTGGRPTFGTYGPRSEPKTDNHSDEPHRGGELYDCPACETVCYCTDSFYCLACEMTRNELREALREDCS